MRFTARTATVLILLLFSPLIALNIFSIQSAEKELYDITYDHLATIVDSKIERLDDYNADNYEALLLLASRTQLRLSLHDFLHNHTVFSQEQMGNILNDATRSVERITKLSIITLNGTVIASTDNRTIGYDYSRITDFDLIIQGTHFGNLFFDKNNTLTQKLSIPLILEDQHLGILLADVTAEKFLDILDDYTGLGNSGEIIIANKTLNGNALVLNPLRFNKSSTLSMRFSANDIDNPVIQAINGEEKFYSYSTDYRGREVLAVTSFISLTEWGIVVKIDHQEALEEIIFQQRLLIFNIIFSIILFSFSYVFIRRYFSKPIEDLTDFANKLSEGKLEERALITSLYEIEVLADRLNNMASNLNRTEIELGRTIEKLKISQESLIHSQKMEAIGRFSGGIAHDFNNLLTVILGYVEIMKYETTDLETKEDILQIEKATKKAKELTTQLLQVSKKTYTKGEIISIPEVIDEVAFILRRLLRENIEFVINHELEEVYSKIERSKFEQILLNLAINASDAMKDGGTFSIITSVINEYSIENEIYRGNFIKIDIQDTGIGMSEQLLSRVFEPFYTTKKSGTGLGLSVAYGIIKQYHGEIKVTSKENKGTLFEIYLPTTKRPSEIVIQEKKMQSLDISDLSILIVEDEYEIKILLQKLLIRRGISPVLAINAKDAIEIIKNNHIDLLITDIVMPDMDGRKLAEIAKRYQNNLRTLLISGYSNTVVELENNQEYLQKPFSASDLIDKIKVLFSNSL